jgi:pantothenate kinase
MIPSKLIGEGSVPPSDHEINLISTAIQGAAFTFNLQSYKSFLDQITQPLTPSSPDIPFPTFLHSVKDPVPSPIPISASHRIILIEGLYTHSSLPGWKECSDMLDMRIWVEVDREMAKERMVVRNYEAGIVNDLEACRKRVEEVDMVTGEDVRRHRVKPDEVIVSVDVVFW